MYPYKVYVNYVSQDRRKYKIFTSEIERDKTITSGTINDHIQVQYNSLILLIR